MCRAEDIARFFKDRGCLKSWRRWDIINLVQSAAQQHTLVYTLRDQQLDSAVVGEFRGNKELYIVAIASRTLGGFKRLVFRFTCIFPGYTLTAHRGDKFVKYNTEKLCKKILNLK